MTVIFLKLYEEAIVVDPRRLSDNNLFKNTYEKSINTEGEHQNTGKIPRSQSSNWLPYLTNLVRHNTRFWNFQLVLFPDWCDFSGSRPFNLCFRYFRVSFFQKKTVEYRIYHGTSRPKSSIYSNYQGLLESTNVTVTWASIWCEQCSKHGSSEIKRYHRSRITSV